MKIIVLGAGLIGVNTAFFLKKAGHDVTVIERQSASAMETSFANGGQISVCYSEPWSSIDNLKKIITWIGKEDSPILLRPKLEMKQINWGLRFLQECLPQNNQENIKKMLKLSIFSRDTLKSLRDELKIEYEQQTNGILTFYTTEKSFEAGKIAANFMSQFGCDRQIKNKEETLQIEPTLKKSPINIVGSDYSKDDESGNAFIFTQKLSQICQNMGVKFLYNTQINKINVRETVQNSKYSDSVEIMNNDKTEILNADRIIVCMGSYSYEILKSIGVYTPIYPAKGYSATIPITHPELINKISLTDIDYKIVLTRLGNNLRVAGTAEFNGYDLSLNKARCEALIARTKKIYPNGLDFDNAKFWTGLRPATPGNVPIIGQTKIKNVFVNSGHGTLGWTMAAGSGKLMEQIINNKELYSKE